MREIKMTEVIYNTYKHNPPHLFRGETKYFITASTYKKLPYLKSDAAKEKLLRSLHLAFNKYNWAIEDWVILNNHYHLMTDISDVPQVLPSIIREAHRFTALWIKKQILPKSHFVESDISNPEHTPIEATRIFYNYWDTCITYEQSYLTRLTYIWTNPVKHGLVESPEDWKYSSYYSRYRNECDVITQFMKDHPSDRVNVKDNY